MVRFCEVSEEREERVVLKERGWLGGEEWRR